MSLTTSSTFNPILSEALNKIGDNQFVGTQILPVRNSPVKNGDYPVFDTDQFDLDAATVRSPGSAFSRRDFDYTKQSFACVQYALEGVLPDEDEAEASENGISDAAGAIAQKLQRDIMIGHEKRVAAALASATFATGDTTAALSSASTATPIKDVQGAVETLNGNGFYDNLALIIETSLFNEMINTDDVRNIFNGNGQYTNRQVLLDAFGVQQVIICPTRFNGANKGATTSRDKIWSTTEYYVAQVAGGEFSNGGIGRTIAFPQGGGVFSAETYRDEPIKSDVLRVFNTVDEVIINTGAGIQLSADS